MKRYVRESELMTNGVAQSQGRTYDSRVVTPLNTVNTVEGEYRVMGIGRGLAIDDCGPTALQACNDAIAAYYQAERAVRPILVPCHLLEGFDTCPGAAASAAPAQ